MTIPLRPTFLANGQRMRFAQLAQLLSIATILISMGLLIWQYQLIQVLRQGGTLPQELSHTNDQWVDTFDWLQLGTSLLAWGAFIFWFQRAYQNAHRLPHAKPDYSASTAGWSWFVPFMNLWVPYRIMGEIGHYYGRFSPYSTQVLSSRWAYWVTGWAVLSVSTIVLARLSSYASAAMSYTPPQMEIVNRLALIYTVFNLLRHVATYFLLRAIAPCEQDHFPTTTDNASADAVLA